MPKKSVEFSKPVNYDTSAVGQEGFRHPSDAVLRLHGFAIHSRPKGGPTTWIRQGEVYTEEEAIRIANLVDQKAGRYYGPAKGYSKETTL